MKRYLTLCLLCCSCIGNLGAYPTAPNQYRDDVYCWYRHDDGRWVVRGLVNVCPEGAGYGYPE